MAFHLAFFFSTWQRRQQILVSITKANEQM